MSEKAPTPSSGKESLKNPLHVEGAPSALQIEAIEKLREKEAAREADLLLGVKDWNDTEGSTNAKKAAYAEFDKMIEDHLAANGIAKDNEKFAEYAALLRSYSVDHIPENIWKDGKRDDDGKEEVPPMRYTAYHEVQGKYAVPVAEEGKPTSDKEPKKDEPAPDDEDPEEKARKEKEEKEKREREAKAKERLEKIEELEKELADVQTAKHKAFAARMAVGYFKRGKKKELNATYEEASQKYYETLEELELLKMEKQDEELAESLIPHNETINEDLQKRFDALLKSDSEVQRKALVEAGGWKAKQLEKYANMSKKKRLLVTIGAGALVAGVAAGITVLTGGVGTVLAIAGGAGTGGLRTAKAYMLARSRLYQKKDEENLDFKLDDTSIDSKEALKQALAKLKGEDEADLTNADRKKRNAVLIGMGAAALGSFGALGLSHITGFHSNRLVSGWGGGKVGDMIAGPESVPNPEAPNLPHWSINTIQSPASSPEFVPTDVSLRPGAGLYEEFGKIPGIQKEHYHELWKEVGPELAKLDNGAGRPFAYEMKGIPGNWGIRMTPDHKMPPEAFKIITDKYQEMFGTPTGGASHTVAEVAQSTDVTLTHADAENLQGIIKMDVIKPEDIASHPELMDKLSYVAPSMPVERFAQHIGLPSEVWLKNLQPYIAEQIGNHNPLYADSFFVGFDGAVRFTGYPNRMRPDTLVDLLRHIPEGVRKGVSIS